MPACYLQVALFQQRGTVAPCVIAGEGRARVLSCASDMAWVARQGICRCFRSFNIAGLCAGPDGEILCGICFCPSDSSEATAMECGHCFCNDCWKTHIRIQIAEGNCRLLGCMAEGCGAVCDDARVSTISIDAQLIFCARHVHSNLPSIDSACCACV